MSDTATILVVDDEAEIQKLLSRHYRLSGHDVSTAGNVQEAILELAQRRFDIVISDILMPGGRLGTDLLSVIREQYPMTHAIMITGYVTLENAMTCMRRGADTCIFKPISDFRELDEAVDRALADINRWKKKLLRLQQLSHQQR